MRIRNLTLLSAVLLFGIAKGYTQPCTTLGQNPGTSFPVCGTATFIQNNVPICGGTQVPAPCGLTFLADKNPFWYSFTCYVGGTLGFLITPNNLADDYDWQIFDVTGKNPANVYTDASMFVACNWSGFSGITGASSAGTSLINCEGNVPIFSSMPTLIAGHDYILLVSHFTNTQSGYRLSFTMGSPGGGTAGITDPANPIPEVMTASPNCDATQVIVRFNKEVKCSSLAANGTDFIISPSGTIVSVNGGCTSGFVFDSLVLTLANPLPPGNYTVAALNGSDGNTLLDNCDRPIVVGDNATFTVTAAIPLPMGTVTPPLCVPTSVTLNFTDPIKCNSIAANGSDFSITGPSAVTVTGATAVNCNAAGETNSITIQFSGPILTTGTYQVQMATGSDGNTVIGPCSRLVTAGDLAPFTLAAQPAIAMGNVLQPPCIPRSITIVFPDPIYCNSLAANGTDFVITGPSAVTIVSATVNNCNASGQATSFTIQLASPILTTGTYQVQVATGSDGNTLVGQCGRAVTAGIPAPFTLAPAPPLPMGTVVPPNCSPSVIQLEFADNILCSSIAANGSDFTIVGPSGAVITSATATCDADGETSLVTLQLAAPILVSGNYQIVMTAGSDGNTLIGHCNRRITAGDIAPFTIPPSFPVPMNNIAPVACSPTSLRLLFSGPLRCTSIAADGSDFIITGLSAVTIASAAGNCNANGLTTSIDIQLSSPIVLGGTYQVQLTTGTDGNTLVSDCNRATAAGSTVSFVVSDTVSAEFQYQIQYDCETDIVNFSHDGQHNVNQWTWTVNGAAAGTSQTLTRSFSASSQNQVQLVVSNGVCSDTYSIPIVLNNKVVVAFDGPGNICPEDTVRFINNSTGLITDWQWTFGNGNNSTAQFPPLQVYPITGTERLYTVSLTGSNGLGCSARATKTINVLSSCVIAVPTAFTPNNDGLNDYLYPLNALKAENLDFRVFNRWGQLVFHSREWTKKWDGRINGIMQATNTYVWTLNFTHRDTKVKYSMQGTSTLIR